MMVFNSTQLTVVPYGRQTEAHCSGHYMINWQMHSACVLATIIDCEFAVSV
jgi:hypothetical protein